MVKPKNLARKNRNAYKKWQNRISNMVMESTVELIKASQKERIYHLVERLELISKLEVIIRV